MMTTKTRTKEDTDEAVDIVRISPGAGRPWRRGGETQESQEIEMGREAQRRRLGQGSLHASLTQRRPASPRGPVSPSVAQRRPASPRGRPPDPPWRRPASPSPDAEIDEGEPALAKEEPPWGCQRSDKAEVWGDIDEGWGGKVEDWWNEDWQVTPLPLMAQLREMQDAGRRPAVTLMAGGKPLLFAPKVATCTVATCTVGQDAAGSTVGHMQLQLARPQLIPAPPAHPPPQEWIKFRSPSSGRERFVREGGVVRERI